MEDVDSELEQDLYRSWGGIYKAMNSLYMASTGGDDWRNFADCFYPVGIHYYFLFQTYIAFFMFVILNTLTSLFIEVTIDCAERDQAKETQRAMQQKSKYLKDFFDAVIMEMLRNMRVYVKGICLHT